MKIILVITLNIFFISRYLDENGWVVILRLNELGRLSYKFLNFLAFIQFFICFNEERWLVIINCLTFTRLWIATLVLQDVLRSWVRNHLVVWVHLIALLLIHLLRSCHLVVVHHSKILNLLHVSNEWRHYILTTAKLIRLLTVWIIHIGIHLCSSKISIHSHHEWLRSHHELLVHFELAASVLILCRLELHHLFLFFIFKIFKFILS
jgi:hypothetical protein